MRTFAEKSQTTRQTASTESATSGRAHAGQSRKLNPMLQLQRTVGNQAVLGLLQTHAEEPKTGMIGTTSSSFGQDFSQLPRYSPALRTIRTKLAVTQPGDAYEQEADRIAVQVMCVSEPQLQRACAGGCPQCQTKQSGQGVGQVQTKHVEADGLGDTVVPPIVHQVLRSPGQPLDAATRSAMEQRFAYDFSRVRVHSGTAAEISARNLNADAYTVGHDIVFAAGQFAPETHAGQQLIAHELTHVVQQQKTDRLALARQPAKQPAPTATQPPRRFETDTAVLDQTNMEEWSRVSFWLDRVGRLFQISISAETAERFKDEEERDAVMAALWRVRPDPTTLTLDQVKHVQIPSLARPEKKQPGEVLYQFVFSPQGANQTKGLVTIRFQAEHPTGVVTYASTPPTGHEKKPSKLAKPIGEDLTQLHYHHEGFPQGDAIGYWERHPDEEKQIFYWIERQGRSFMQIVITRTAEQKGKVVSKRETPFIIRGSKDEKGQIIDLSIELLGKDFDLTQMWLPPDYHSKDGGDVLLERIQEQPDPLKNDRLGKVTLGKVPKEEAVPLKYSIWGYFRMGTRDAEVDTTITVMGTKKRIFYTLRFRQNNDVDVERIGEEGREAKLDPNRLDIASVTGYESNADEPKKLKSWLRKRYPQIKAEGESVVELRESANKSLEVEAGRPGWFKDNYRIFVLDADEGKERLKKFGWNREQLVGLKHFTPEELKLAEISLESMSENILRQLKETRLVRQDTHIVFNKTSRKFEPRPKDQGVTVTSGQQNTVVIFDAAGEHASVRFLGGAAGVRPIDIMTFTHELGHVVANRAGAIAIFNKFVKDEGILPFTPYALKDPNVEFFAEAFFLYNTDPEWLKSSHPKVFDWFEVLSKTGKPPVKKN